MSFEITLWVQNGASYNKTMYDECQNDIKHYRILKQTAQNDAKVTIDFGIGSNQRLRVSSE